MAVEEGEQLETIKVGKFTFRPKTLLGEGAQGQVWLAIEIHRNKQVALKIMPVMERKESDKLQLAKEIKALREIKHKNVIRLLGFDMKTKFQGQDVTVLVYEVCERGEVFEYIRHTGSFKEKVARTVFMDVCNGVKALHDKGVAHRDMKCDNLMFDRDFRAVIIDLGLCNHFNKFDMKTHLGTAAYMAPEVSHRGMYDRKCDVFSMGVILFLMVTGFPPWYKVEDKDWYCKRWKNGNYKDLWNQYEKKIRAALNKDLKDLLQNMLVWNPQQRFSVEQVLSSPWMNEGVVTSRELKALLEEKWQEVEKKREVEKRGLEGENVRKKLEADKAYDLTLADIATNKFREAFALAKTKEDIRKVMVNIGDQNKKIADFADAEFIDFSDPVTFGRLLSTACDDSGLKNLVKYDKCHVVAGFLNENNLGVEIEFSEEMMDFVKQYKYLDKETPVIRQVSKTLSTYPIRCTPAVVLYTLRNFCKDKKNLDFEPLEYTNVQPHVCKLTLTSKIDYAPDVEEVITTEILVKVYRLQMLLEKKEELRNSLQFVRKSKHCWCMDEFNETVQLILSSTILDACK